METGMRRDQESDGNDELVAGRALEARGRVAVWAGGGLAEDSGCAHGVAVGG